MLLFALTRGASWNQLAALLRELVGEEAIGAAEPETLTGAPSGDLFALANAVGALLDAPVTIEDRSSRLLAFSSRQDEADESRIETVLGRQVPERYMRRLEELGAFRRLYASDRPVYIQPGRPGHARRLVRPGGRRGACRRRAARLDLGGPARRADPRAGADLRRHREARRAAPAADPRRRRRRPTPGRRPRRRRPSRAVPAPWRRWPGWGSPTAPSSSSRWDWPRSRTSARPCHWRGARPTAQRATDALAVHLSALHPGAVVAAVGGVSYGLLPVAEAGDAAEERVARVATEFVTRASHTHPRCHRRRPRRARRLLAGTSP